MKIWQQPKRHGSTMTQWNLETDGGKPLGAIWTFPNTKTERYPYTLKLLSDEKARHFKSLQAAKETARAQA